MRHDRSDNQFKGKEEFLSLLAANQRKIFSYILAAVGRRNIAEEIMQQTLLIMWKDFDRFETGTNFSAWGKKIAYHKILEYRKRNAKSVLFDSEVLQKFLDMSQKTSTGSDDRGKALEGCMKKLKESSLRILSMRYNQQKSCKEISEEIDRPIQTVYKNMSRIYMALKECIDRTIAVWSSES
jgi:RNA polymerase sigma-70 factor (ECF subfamily)